MTNVNQCLEAQAKSSQTIPHKTRTARYIKKQSTSTGLSVGTLTNISEISIAELRRVLTSKGVSFGRNDSKTVLFDVLIAQLIEETYAGRASSSDMSVDTAPLN